MGNSPLIKQKQLDNTQLACTIGKNVKNVIGLSSSSASPSDQWILEFKTPYKINGEKISQTFAKFFITNENTKELQYEMEVYYQKTKALNDYLICPFFVPCYTRAKDCSLENIMEILRNHVRDFKTNEILSTDELLKRFRRNLFFLTYSIKNRSSLNQGSNDILKYLDTDEKEDMEGTGMLEVEDSTLYLDKVDTFTISEKMNEYSYNFILTKVMEKSSTQTLGEYFDEIIDGLIALNEGSIDKESLENLEFRLRNIKPILFQIMCAIYAMYLSQMTHNDLHLGNIFITKLSKPTTIVHLIENETFQYITDFQVQVYDFDRTYVHSLGNNPWHHKDSVYNTINPYTDIFKLFCTLNSEQLSRYEEYFQWEYLEQCLINVDETPDEIKDFLKGQLEQDFCFVMIKTEYIDGKPVMMEKYPENLFDYLYSPYQVLKNFANLLDISSEMTLLRKDQLSSFEVFMLNELQFDENGNVSEKIGQKTIDLMLEKKLQIIEESTSALKKIKRK